jgi:hypothetical protein
MVDRFSLSVSLCHFFSVKKVTKKPRPTERRSRLNDLFGQAGARPKPSLPPARMSRSDGAGRDYCPFSGRSPD